MYSEDLMHQVLLATAHHPANPALADRAFALLERSLAQQPKAKKPKGFGESIRALCHTHALAGNYDRAFDLLEQVRHQGVGKVIDVFDVAGFFPEALKDEAQLATAWTTLSARQVSWGAGGFGVLVWAGVLMVTGTYKWCVG